MGTLQNQPPRDFYSIDESRMKKTVEMLKKVSADCKITLDQTIKIYEIDTLNRKIDTYVANGDIKDEQLMGFAKLIDEFLADGIPVKLENQRDY